MPIISNPNNATQKADLKPIGICVPTNSSLDMSSSSTTLATNRVVTTSSNANYYNSSSSSTSTSIPVGALSVMVARFATSSDTNSRQQTVILHPRTISSGNRSGLQMSATSLRGSTVISGQTISTTCSTPSLTSSTPSISVRQLIGGQQHGSNAMPVLNLSTVTNANTSGVPSHSSSSVKQVCAQSRPFITTTGSLPIESVSLVMTNPNDSNIVRPIRLHTNAEMKPNTALHNINKISSPRTAVMTGSTIVATQPTKMISIGGSGPQNASAISQHVARVGIIGQLPLGSGVTSTANKSGIINLAATSLPKGFIFNSQTNLNTGNTIHNMVNVSASIASFGSSAQSSQSAKLSVNPTNNNIITSRHSIVPTPYVSQQSLTNVAQQQPLQQSHRTTLHPNANINTNMNCSQSQQVLQSTTTVSSSPLRPTILSSPASSPVKQTQLQPNTPSSPRPSILIRKRIANDCQNTPVFKTSSPNTAITASSAPLRVSNFNINSNDLSLGQTNTENRTIDSLYPLNDAKLQPNCVTALPTTPNSEGNQTPRKKPRKQLLEPTTRKSSQNIQLLNNSSVSKMNSDICNDKESVHINKKPRVSLLSSYNMQWKSLQYHFVRYSDVRPKPEKKLTLSELSNEGLQRKNGWKIHHLATQMEVMTDNEVNVHQRLTQFLDTFEKDLTNQCSTVANTPNNNNTSSVCDVKPNRTATSDISIKLNDLIRGNLQRSNLFSDQINEARHLIIKLTNDHKERVGKITKKCANKRTYITK